MNGKMKSIVAGVCAAAGVGVLCQVAFALPQYDPYDPIDLDFGVLATLESVERACICRACDGEADWIPEPGDGDLLAGAIRLPYGGDWYNCMAADVAALMQLGARLSTN